MMTDDNKNTKALNLNDPEFLELLQDADDNAETIATSAGNHLSLQIGDTRIRLDIHAHQTYFLGRFTEGIPNEINLNPYRAMQQGVSRMHAKITIDDNNIYVTDLNSSNGTYLGKNRLQPQEQTRLNNGDILLLGRLKIQIAME